MTLTDVGIDIEKMTNLLAHILSLSERIGQFGDGPHLREHIQEDVRLLAATSQSVKTLLVRLKSQGVCGLDSYLERYDSLRMRIQQELPGVIQRLRGSTAPADEPPAEPDMNQPLLMDQSLLDAETEAIGILEQDVNAILTGMREVTRLFTEVFQQIQAQHHIIQAIETETTGAVSEMSKGNENLQDASKHQKKAIKCVCWILMILLLVVVAVVMVVLSQTIWKSPATPAPTMTVSPSPPPDIN
jgi:hypothetical protein